MSDGAMTRAIELAVEARERSYAPYSGFAMGAAIVGTAGEEVQGALVENVSLGLAMCSERVALFNAVVRGVTPAVLALCSPRTGSDLTYPCGACLQVALEVAGPDLTIIAVDTEGHRDESTVGRLLPRGPHRHTASHHDATG